MGAVSHRMPSLAGSQNGTGPVGCSQSEWDGAGWMFTVRMGWGRLDVHIYIHADFGLDTSSTQSCDMNCAVFECYAKIFISRLIV